LVSDEKVDSSTSQRLLIPRPIYSAMIAQALAEAPLECCGLLAGRDGRVVRQYPLVNAAASPVEYESDARGMFTAWRDMRQYDLDILAVYHSHPTSPPVPSRKDRERNYSELVVNLIISLQSVEPEMRGWWLSFSDHREAAWEVFDGEANIS
jgi:proteasome lid subunit RPN8/RPN11